MDSLFANYASSDDDEPGKERGRNPSHAPQSTAPPPPPTKSLFNSLPPPKSSSSSSSLFSSLPPPKIAPSPPSSSSSSIFSSLPPPKSEPKPGPAKPVKVQPSEPKEKKVVQFRPPVYPAALRSEDDDDDEEERRRKEKRHLKDFSSKPLSSIIPPPKNSLCLAPTASASSSRISVVEHVIPVTKPEVLRPLEEERSGVEQSDGHYGNWACGSEAQGQYSSGGDGGEALQSWTSNDGVYHASEGSYYPNGENSYESYESYDGSWGYVSAAPNVMSEPPLTIPDMGRIGGKRGRNEIPAEILEVKQEELVKDRPREDQTKLTGIAFGPSYQPVSSQKGKPSKLHKRKHQIGALYYDLKQKEMELAERRSRGMLTKRETQGKYGW